LPHGFFIVSSMFSFGTYPKVADHFAIVRIEGLTNERESFRTQTPMNLKKMRELQQTNRKHQDLS
jgi:hypothetical protein